jgi:hypothetical protein
VDLFDFIERFPEEKDCLEYFISLRRKAGIQCQRCGHDDHIWISVLNQFECTKCKNHISIKSGSVMENSKLPIKYWFMAIHLITADTEKYTLSEIQEKLSGAAPELVSQMLISLNSCSENPQQGQSFDQLLLACIGNHHHPPEIPKIDQNKK